MKIDVDELINVLSGLLVLIGIVSILLGVGLTVTSGIVYLLSLVFNFRFSLKIVTATWLSVLFLKMIFSSSDKRKKQGRD